MCFRLRGGGGELVCVEGSRMKCCGVQMVVGAGFVVAGLFHRRVIWWLNSSCALRRLVVGLDRWTDAAEMVVFRVQAESLGW